MRGFTAAWNLKLEIMQGRIINGVFKIAPPSIKTGKTTRYPGSAYYRTLGYKNLVIEPWVESPYMNYDISHVESDDKIIRRKIATLKEGAELAIARKQEIVKRIRLRYDADDVEAILRQQMTKQEEFEEYNTYAEACKAEVDAEIVAIRGLM